MIKADGFYNERHNKYSAVLAVGRYGQIAHKEPENIEAVWKLGRATWFLGEFHPTCKKSNMYKESMDYFKVVSEKNDSSAELYLWYGSIIGLYGQERGVMQSLFLLDSIKKNLQKSISLNPVIDGGGAYRAMGRLYFTLPPIVGGSNEKSLEYLKKAEEITPHPITLMCIADTLIAMKEKTAAKEALNELINLKLEGEWVPETMGYIPKAKAKLNLL